jgi:hypothetical protein
MKRFIIPALMLVLISCSKQDTGGISLTFYPRHCIYIYLVPGMKVQSSSQNFYDQYRDVEQGATIKADSLVLAVLTSNFEISNVFLRGYPGLLYPTINQFQDENNIVIENKIKLLYENSYTLSSGAGSTEVPVEYRLDGIKSMKITTLITQLFGVPLGGSLNNYFTIKHYLPEFIISSDGQNLLYPDSGAEFPSAISEWIGVSPMAQPAMYLEFNAIPDELPQTVRFVLEMETMSGTILTYTSFPVTLIK